MKNKIIILAILVFSLVSPLFSEGKGESPMLPSGEALPPPGMEKENYTKPPKETLRDDLSVLQYRVTQEEGTETPFQNTYWDNHEEGIYVDIVSGEPLFSSLDKYESGTGWPSFTRPISEGNIASLKDNKLGMARTEVRSYFGDSHLGHVFKDGPEPTGLRYCINSASLRFVPLNKMKDEGYGEYLSLFPSYSGSMDQRTIRGPLPPWDSGDSMINVETAVLAGGCFWGVEGVYEQLNGVLSVESGYSGGKADTAQYKLVGTGQTGHAEVVQIFFDPSQISYRTILEVFFTVAHDPTQLNYQGPDRGTEYRSAVFYTNEEQRKITRDVITSLEQSGTYSEEVVTQVVPLDAFYPAEDYHQDFLRLNPTHPYIAYWDIPKIEDLWSKYPELLAVE